MVIYRFIKKSITLSLNILLKPSTSISRATSEFGLGLNFAFPWAYIAWSASTSFNDYKVADSSVTSAKLRSDNATTTDLMITKAIGDIFPAIDPNRSLFINLSYEKTFSEANIMNYDYLADSFALSFSKALRLN